MLIIQDTDVFAGRIIFFYFYKDNYNAIDSNDVDDDDNSINHSGRCNKKKIFISSYPWRRCLLHTVEQLFSSAPPGCHRACSSVVSALAVCPASKHHVVGSTAAGFMQERPLCFFGLAVHVGIESAVPSFQPEQNDQGCSVQFIRLSD